MTPTSTYRLQITHGFTLDDAVAQVPRLAALGISHLYLSPLLQAAPGSDHGYDVTDHGLIDVGRGGLPALQRLSAAARAHGLGLVLDIVPNHMSVAVPHENRPWWSVLQLGQDSPYATWFDVDWSCGPILIPILGSDDEVSALEVVDDELRYAEHRFPCAPGTRGGTPQEVHDRQHYRLVDWRRGSAELTYRRFFDVSDLAGLRIEDDAVFDATHALVVDLVRDGTLDGLRIDHPDGLADPAAYLSRLRAQTGGTWVVVEKILEPGEVLPPTWQCAGTTGYDAARLVTGSFVDPSGRDELEELWQRHGGSPVPFGDLVLEAKTEVTRTVLAAEVLRLARTAPEIGADAIAHVLARFPVYRSYLPHFGRGYLEAAGGGGYSRLSDPDDPLCVRFQQTSGMVMAKGVEDTAFYRHHVLDALNEVGSDPAAFGVLPEEWHSECVRLDRDWPDAMTLLSTHDSKRSEDVRARLVLMSQDPARWAAAVSALDDAARPHVGRVAPEDVYLLHQTLCGTGVLEHSRIGEYLRKATREAKRHTSWLSPDEAYDADLQALARAVLEDPAYLSALSSLHADWRQPWERAVLAQKLLQLTMPGIPDLYQGSERPLISLVDPDNRRPVDYAPLDAQDAPKTALVRTVLGLRRHRPELFRGYAALDAGPDALAFHRSPDLAVVVAIRPIRLQHRGFGDARVELDGAWTDLLTGAPYRPLLDALVGERAGAVLVRR